MYFYSAFDSNTIGDDDKPYNPLGYTNGPGYDVHRRNAVDGTEQPRLNLTGKESDIGNKNLTFSEQAQQCQNLKSHLKTQL